MRKTVRALGSLLSLSLLVATGCGLSALVGTGVALSTSGKSSSSGPSPPTVTTIVPSAGSHGGGSTITITGSGFTDATTVTIGGIAATNVVVTGGTLTATVPRSATTGAKDVVVANQLGGSTTVVNAFTYTNAAPTVIVGSLSSPQAGNIVVSFTVVDPESDLADVQLAVDTGGGFQTIPASQVLSGGLVGLTSSPTGVLHTLTWASRQTFPSLNFAAATLRVTPTDQTDGVVGTPGTSNIFAIANDVPLEVVLAQPVKSSFNIALTYTVKDSDPGEAPRVTTLTFLELLTGRSGTLTVKSGQGLGPCPYSATGTLVTTVWDTLADIGFGNDKLVTVTVGVSDGKASSVQTTAPFFVSNGPLDDAQTYPNTLSLSGLSVGDITSDGRVDIIGTSTQNTFPGNFTLFLNRGQNFAQITAIQAPFIPGMPLPNPPRQPNGDATPISGGNTFLFGHAHPGEVACLDADGDGALDLLGADSINNPNNFDNLLETYYVSALPQTVADVNSNFTRVMAHMNTITCLQKLGLPDVANGTYESTQAAQAQISPIVRIPGLFGQGTASTFPQATSGDNSFDFIGWFCQDLCVADLDGPGTQGNGRQDLVILHGFRQLGPPLTIPRPIPPNPVPAATDARLLGAIVIRQHDPRTNRLGGGTTATNFYLDPTDMGTIPTHVAVGDIDSGTHTGAPFGFLTGAGSPDVVAANSLENSLTFYLQYDAASWPPAPANPVPPRWVSFKLPMSTIFSMVGMANPPSGDTIGIAIADLNGDGSNDMVVVGRQSKSVVLLVFDPNPAAPLSLVTTTDGLLPFRVAGVLALPQFLGSRPALADVTGDGRVDIIVPGGLSNELLIYRNTGVDASSTPQFTTAPIRFTSGFVPFDVATADFNRDRRTDVALANRLTQDVSVYFQRTPGSLDFRFVPIPTGTAPVDLAAGDMTGDGIRELACSNSGDNSLWVFGRSTTALLAPLRKYDLAVRGGVAPDECEASSPHTIAMADLRGTGRMDVLVAMEFVNMGTAVSGARPQPNGKTQVGGVEIIYGSDPLPASVALVITGTLNPIGTAVGAGRFLDDGGVNIVLTESGQSSTALTPKGLTFYKQDGAAYVASGTIIQNSSGGLGLSRIVVADMNADGMNDLVLARGGSTSMSIYYQGFDVNNNTTPPTFTFVRPGYFGTRPLTISNVFGSPLGRVSDIAVADVDSDGRQDIVFSGYTTASAGVHFQTSPNAFTGVALPAGDAAGQVALGDLDGDGLVDIAIPWGTDALLAVYYQNRARTGPDDTFFGPVTVPTATQPGGCAILDVDGDGRNDVAVACRGSNSVCVFLQR